MDGFAELVVAGTKEAEPAYGLRQHVLSPLETLAQSVSTIAPSTSPALTIPLVFALAGQGTVVAYGIAMAIMVLMSLCIATFARDSASPGSLYVHVRSTMPPVCSVVAAWALFFAYVMTAASVIGGFINYAYVFLGAQGRYVPPVALAALAAGSAVWVAYRDVKISARLMLWIEAASVLLIAVVVGATIWRHGLHVDVSQFRLSGMSATSIRLGVVLAIFSFVGFESATTLGAEAKNPLRTIPRAVIQSALLAGVFFVVCSYGEVLGFAGAKPGLGESTAPMRYLAGRAGVGILGPVIDAGVLVSMFAATLACVIAAARVLMLMAHHGLASRHLSRTHKRNETPALASLLAAVLAFVPVAVMVERGVSGADVYGWMGALAVFGFLTAYGLAAVAMMVHLRQRGRLKVGSVVLSVVATLAMLAVLLGTLFPVPPAPYRAFPFFYAGYLVAGLAWYFVSGRRTRGA